MSQYEPNVAPAKSFISKINSKFSNLSISSGIQNIHSDKDGSSNDDTLIHNAFVKFFESRGEPYPEWLGVKKANQDPRSQQSYSRSTYQHNSEFQPVRTQYNTGAYNQQQYQPQQYQPQQGQAQQQYQQYDQESQGGAEVGRKQSSYTPRSSSKLFDLYNKSRQQAVPGSGYNAQSAPAPARSNTSGAHSSRLRERMMNQSPSMNNLSQAAGNSTSANNSSGSKATWGRRG